MSTDDRPSADEDRVVDLVDDDGYGVPDRTADEIDRNWDEGTGSNDDRLLEDRPPHW